MTPTDPLYASQWHFPLLGDIETIWDEFVGAGVYVGIYDDGVEYTHPDLAANYDSSRHVVDGSLNPIDPFPVLSGDGHGTSVAGLIGAEANNGQGGVGVAHGTNITGVNIFGSSVYGYVNGAVAPFLDVVHQAAGLFDISSNSWGSTPNFSTSQNLQGAGSFANLLAGNSSEYSYLSSMGNGGLGTVITQAAGNDTRDANGSGVNASRFTATIAATDSSGNLASYSNYGSSILVAAPAGAVTTDRTGAAGYDPGDYTSSFGGTSAATPVTTGVVALMLDAAGGSLGWRDVQNILALSASHTGSALGGPASGFEPGPWQFNNAGNWNGGGAHISPAYGFGMVNAYNAVRFAEVWHLFGAAQTSANEAMTTSTIDNNGGSPVTLPDGNSTGHTFTVTVGTDLEIEHVALLMDFSTTYAGDISILVTSPDGTTVQALFEDLGIGTNFTGTWQFGIDHLLGEMSAGTWTITVADNFGGDIATVNSVQLEIYGAAASNNDVHHFTDEFFDVLALDPTRGTFSDTNGGIDWMNLAAIAGDVVIGLAGGSVVTVGGVTAGTNAGGFENVVTGDGNDSITGNSLQNHLVGMRGNDTINGSGGADTLDGDQGNDVLNGGAGNDSVLGGDGNDSLTGYNGADTLNGGQGDDTLLGQAGSDSLLGSYGVDQLNGGGGNDSLLGNDGADVLNGGSGNDQLIGGNGNDSLLGQAGSDNLSGDTGADTINGGAGLDTINGNAGSDLIDGGLGADTLNGGGGLDTIHGNAGSDLINGGDAADSLLGEGGNDTLFGNAGADTLSGGAGNDSLGGQGGNDSLLGGTGVDVFDFNPGTGDDTIGDWQNNIDDIDLSNIGSINNLTQFQAAATQVGLDVLVDLGGGNSVTILNATIGQFDAGDLIF